MTMNKVQVLIVSVLALVVLAVNPSARASGNTARAGTENNTTQGKGGKTLTFVLKDGGKTQTLVVHFISEYKIRFVLKIDGTCKKTVSGIATGVNGDYELEEEDNGDTWPAISYQYYGKDNYSLSMDIAVKTLNYKQDKAILSEAEDQSRCQSIVKTMRLVKN